MMTATAEPGAMMFGLSALSKPVVGSTGCPLLIGTSGYSYTEWSDSGFYPPGTRTADMLGLYMRFFPVVELNYTWYQMPRAEAVARMAVKVPADFRFAAKLTRTLTHERREDRDTQLQLYRRGIEPLGDRLAAVLIQLPPNFNRTEQNRYYLAKLLDGLQGLPLAVEFRHASWAVDQVFAELERRNIALVAVDAPPLPGLFPPLDIVTSTDFFYLRFHGRNRSGWRSSNMQKKFDYDYSTAELQEWARGGIRTMSEKTSKGMIFFNNHVRAQAPRNAGELQRILRDS
ncbi:DUF72 domain-containing protein [Desulfopila inferna]|uniref:DUF72 domain-containing protein n=1 Tax=Desulfopila inferna TaxID=468528 RepID=UPI001F063100|nr:DUF72 domain-containing protein [Desulfopila inferna]